MATIVFQAAGAALGGMFGPIGSIIGRAAGGLLGAAVDRSLLGGGANGPSPKLKNLDVTASTEGTPIARVWGRARLPGQIIWATRLKAVTRSRDSGGKGLASSGSVETTSYYANVALGICEGPIAHVSRVWADGKPLNTRKLAMRIYLGAAEQEPDPLIIAKEGAASAPAYRGLAYAVFENLPLEEFGNRIPQLSFEVIRPVGALEDQIHSVCLIPGATEFGYDTRAVSRKMGLGETASENRHTRSASTNLDASLDELQALCPNLQNVSLIVAWFGDDLRAGHCSVAPRVDSKSKRTSGATWSVAGLERDDARLVSMVEGRPAYGGSPSDESVVRAIRAIKGRGLGVTLYPFLMMDIPAGNTLPDPVSGTAPQPPYPWRGQVAAADPSAVAADVARFFGDAKASHFLRLGEQVIYLGPAEWSWRRFVLHAANLARVAGGVDALVIGSEFRDLTRSRDADGIYPAAAELVDLASEVSTTLGAGTKITYAADWTEYGADVRDEGATVRFPLDPLWASSHLDAVGIDFYPPLADWRAGGAHLDRVAGQESVYDAESLAANVTGGEAFDWFYAGPADRLAQHRLPITDGLDKPWTFRAKDLAGWWSQPHVDRTGGVEHAEPTDWVPGSKPIWLTEIGCPAVDKGANAPNMFPDDKSSAASIPPFSSGGRDDLMQRRALEAVLDTYDATSDRNPVSPIYAGRMVDRQHSSVWCWDARPFPEFPRNLDVWSDGVAHETGHWLNGRLGQAPLAELTAAVLQEAGADSYRSDQLEGVVDGYVVDRPASARELLEPLADLFGFGAFEREGAIHLVPRGRGQVRNLVINDLAENEGDAAPAFVRGQESEIPTEIAVGFEDLAADYRPSVTSARRGGVGADAMVTLQTSIVGGLPEMGRAAAIRLQDLWIARDIANFSVAPAEIALEPGDLVTLPVAGHVKRFEVIEIADGPVRRVSCRAVEPAIFDAPRLGSARLPERHQEEGGAPEVIVLDLPDSDGGTSAVLSRIAIAAKPWPRAMIVWKDSGGSFDPVLRATTPAVLGETLDALAPGAVWRFDLSSFVHVRVVGAELMGASEERLFAGANAAAIETEDGGWEVLQFGSAELVSTGVYRLSHFLRGQSGTEAAAGAPKSPGRRFVLLDDAVLPLVSGVDALGRPTTFRVSAAGRDFADEDAVGVTVTSSAEALLPWAPVHLRADWQEEDIAIGWIRRTRSGGDTWDATEVPLAEENEAYLLQIMKDGVAVRQIRTGASGHLYTAAEQTADFGAPQTVIGFRVAQISAVAGPGKPAEGTFHA
jgi:hypothetical protein